MRIILITIAVFHLFALCNGQDLPVAIIPLSKYEFVAVSTIDKPLHLTFKGKSYQLNTIPDKRIFRYWLNKRVGKLKMISPYQARYSLDDLVRIGASNKDFHQAVSEYLAQYFIDEEELVNKVMDLSQKTTAKDFENISVPESVSIAGVLIGLRVIKNQYNKIIQKSTTSYRINSLITSKKVRRKYRAIQPFVNIEYRGNADRNLQLWAIDEVGNAAGPKLNISFLPEVLFNKERLNTGRLYLTAKFYDLGFTLRADNNRRVFIDNDFVTSSVEQSRYEIDRARILVTNQVVEVGIKPSVSFGALFSAYLEAGAQYKLQNSDLEFEGDLDSYFLDDQTSISGESFTDVIEDKGEIKPYGEAGLNLSLTSRSIKNMSRRGLNLGIFLRFESISDVTFTETIFTEETGGLLKDQAVGNIDILPGIAIGISF